MESLETSYPNYSKVVDLICRKSPFQKKAVKRLIERFDRQYFDFAESFIKRLLEAADHADAHEFLAVCYLDYTKSIRLEEMHFAKYGEYRVSDYDEVYENVYSRNEYMFFYVVGLGMTQVFWPNHYAIVRFFLDEFIPLIKESRVGAEAGVGHGLFHSEFLRGASKLRTTMLDVSEMSLNMTLRMISASGLDPDRATPVVCDVQKNIPLEDASLDGLLMGELIEHIQDGESVMRNMSKKMKPSGYCFFTTACNAPAEDHILLFRNIGEVHSLLARTGWMVHKEHIGTLNNMTVEEAIGGGHNINYAAILKMQVK